ncbi:hypothetical protein HME9302_00347 [Alteripontixanthobacter maritimus]|uniref:Flagellar protein FlgN n=1 Tax=Alteripontixanthobacter maritimus TaxID=2161824 RepID=A0A369Q3S6_9SPHN|nr:flagellar protein FlgN [Alteripontixanthobacter maritimus]RDC59162.1 hypothetical protein HME9302_00347 [Alteripontixanthobacter maritimus]
MESPASQTGNANAPATLNDNLRQMVAALEAERQSLAGLDRDGITSAADRKDLLCSVLAGAIPGSLDEEGRALVRAAAQKNETNRRIRNLLATNVAARLDALSGSPGLYTSPNAAMVLQRA